MNLRRMCALACVWTGFLAAQKPIAPRSAPASPVVASSGGYQLTEDMIRLGLRYAQILAGADFSTSDTTVLRNGLIATFKREPAKQAAAYESVAKSLREQLSAKPTWLDVAVFRYRVWQYYAENPQLFRSFESYPLGAMVLKYNPVLVNSGGMIVTRLNVDCQFYSNALVAKAAGVAAPTQADEQRFERGLASQFSSMPQEQRRYLREAESRLWSFNSVYEGSVKTRATIIGDIKKSAHSAADVPRVARQVENDSVSRYHQLYMAEGMGALTQALRVNNAIVGIGGLGRSASRSADINTGMSPGYNQFPH